MIKNDITVRHKIWQLDKSNTLKTMNVKLCF